MDVSHSQSTSGTGRAHSATIPTNSRVHRHSRTSFSFWSGPRASRGTRAHAPGFSLAHRLLETRSSVRAPAQSATGFGEPGEQTSDSGGERKMEVRVGERLLCLAVLSSVLYVDSVFGKYVKGIVNTKEVSAAVFFVCLISCHLRRRHRLVGVGFGLDCVSARRCLCVGLFRG